MKTAKLIFSWIVFLVGVVLAVAIFLPENYKIERSVSITAPRDRVYTLVANYRALAQLEPVVRN